MSQVIIPTVGRKVWFRPNGTTSLQRAGTQGAAITMAAMVLLSACTVVPTTTVRQTCDLLDTALDEAQMAEAWYLEAGKVLQACGARDAIERAESKACYARRFNDDSVVCP